MKVTIHRVNQGGNFIELLLNGSADVDYLKDELEAAGFENVQSKQPSGLAGTNMHNLVIHNKPDATTSDTLAFLKSHQHVKFT